MRKLKYWQAINEATVQCIEEHPSIVLTGIGVDDLEGIFGTTLEAARPRNRTARCRRHQLGVLWSRGERGRARRGTGLVVSPNPCATGDAPDCLAAFPRSGLIQMRRFLLVLALSVLSVCATGCDDQQRDMWVQALRDCGITDVDPARTLYFGPSQNAGPGSGWRETFKNRKHVDYRLRFGSDELPGPKAFIRLSPAGYQCKDGREVTFKLNTDIAVHVSTLPLSAELSNDLRWARTIRISVGGMGWDELNESDYEEYFRKTLGP